MIKEIKVLCFPWLDITYDTETHNIHIKDSYQVTDNQVKLKILKEINQQVQIQRPLNSQLIEWRAHNTLYRWGLFKSHTKDVDINEKEKWWRIVLYPFFAVFE